MSNQKIVIALGGNSILTDDATAEAQQNALKKTAKYLLKIVEGDNKLIITHGNGPQVGNLLLQQAAAESPENPAMPLDTTVAMTQGSLGYWLQNALQEALAEKNIHKQAATVITQVLVDPNDQAFSHPTKPIGPFYKKEAAERFKNENPNDQFIEDAGRGYRRVVPSPKPLGIIEEEVINQLMNNGVLTICGGGGGIPVVKKGNSLQGIEGVIDKDHVSAKIAELMDADLLLILTAVDNVYINFKKPDEKKLENVSIKEMKKYISEGQFAKGSMLPKVEAAVNFVEANPHGKVVISSLENIEGALNNASGTIITANEPAKVL